MEEIFLHGSKYWMILLLSYLFLNTPQLNDIRLGGWEERQRFAP